jgi:hypothetical protein
MGSTGSSHSQAAPWTSTDDVRFLPAPADFIRHFPHMNAVGARQHPQQ